MKNTFFIILIIALVLGALVWLLKPEMSVDSSQSAEHAVQQSTQVSTYQALSNAADQQLQTSSLADIVAESSDQTLFDTKSDMSIQPIDPESDPGNQIVETKN